MQATEKLLSKGRISSEFKSITDPQQRRAILSEYSSLLKEHEGTDKILMNHLKNAILPAVAINRVLPRFGVSETEARKIIRRAILESAKPMGRVFQGLGRVPGFYSLFKLMCKMSAKTAFGPLGWDMRWLKTKRDEIRWDCHSCFYHDVFSKYKMPELTPYFCESDDVMYGGIPGIKWGRTKTIGKGAKICDFYFFRDKKNLKNKNC